MSQLEVVLEMEKENPSETREMNVQNLMDYLAMHEAVSIGYMERTNNIPAILSSIYFYHFK